MAMTTEPRRAGEHIVSEANGSLSRDQAVLAAGDLPAGAVLALNGTGDYVQVAPAAIDGTEVAVAVLYAAVDATGGAAPCVVHARNCEVHGEALTWPDAATTGQIETGIAQLADQDILVR